MKEHNFKQPLPKALKILVVGVALPVLAFCVFGFLATFEPGPPLATWTFRIGYALAGIAVSVFAGRLALGKRNSTDIK